VTFLTGEAPWFAFLVHPRDVPDFIAMPGGTLIRDNSESDEEFVAKASANPPMVLADVVVGAGVRGELIGVGRLPDAMLTPDGHRAVVEAVDLAVQRGAPVIGLGALTAPATAGGRALLKRIPRTVSITNGNGLTAAVVRRNVHEASKCLGLGTDCRVALLGATGSVGVASSRLLAADGYRLTLVGASRQRVERTLGDLLAQGHTGATGLDALRHADIAVLLTNAATAKVAPAMFSEGAVVIDVAQPCNVVEPDVPGFAAAGVTVKRGGVVRIPGYACKETLGLDSPQDTFACLAETYLMAREGLRESSVGRPSAEYASRMDGIARRHGVVIRSLGLSAAPSERPAGPGALSVVGGREG
jgi:fatty aldehyde-generating acyl-ACP reductase